MCGSANPEDPLEVLEDADHLFVRKAAFGRKHVHMLLGIEPAHTVPGSEPDAAFRGDVYRLHFLIGQAFGKGPETEIVGAVRIDAEQASFGGEIDFAPGIEGQCGWATKRIVDLGQWELMEDSAFDVGDAPGGDHPDSAGRSKNELAYMGAGQALLETEAQNMIAIEAK